ncbi:MAG: hypothetical protein HRU18_03060 [Pseudoalteromonas sp.]|uniref:hypothetical protein n=1 Tax=Pseudoalteromonas sp. TaxID=53249 RepID=UPI001E04FDFD|nr:hypothetical protein [Pseudoalteromonas sp.]NRA77164.1 hypothetical protein [Pseudoalteromonas sp.]
MVMLYGALIVVYLTVFVVLVSLAVKQRNGYMRWDSADYFMAIAAVILSPIAFIVLQWGIIEDAPGGES